MKSNTAIRIAIIVVNYHSASESIDFANTLKGNPLINLFIVNNGDSEEGLLKLASCVTCLDNVKLLEPEENLGYFGGARFAHNFLLKTYLINDFDWVVISNADISVDWSSLINGLSQIKQAGDNTKLMWVAPRIISKLSGRNQNPHLSKRPSRLKYYFLSAIFYIYPLAVIHRLLSILKNKIITSRKKIEKNRYVYSGHGSFIILNSNYFSAGGDLNSRAFLFCEENYLAEKILRLGGKVFYADTIEVVHVEHITTGIIPSRKMVKFLAEAHYMCASDYMA